MLCRGLSISLCCWQVRHSVTRTARPALVRGTALMREVLVGPTHNLYPHHSGCWASTKLTAESLTDTHGAGHIVHLAIQSPPHGCPLWVRKWDTHSFHNLCSLWKFHPRSSLRILFVTNPFSPESPTLQTNCQLLSMSQCICTSDHLSIQTKWTTKCIAPSPAHWEDFPSPLSCWATPEWMGLYCCSICFQLMPTYYAKPSVN